MKITTRRTKGQVLQSKADIMIPAALLKIQQIGKLAKYSLTADQKTKIVTALKSQVSLVEKAFTETDAPAEVQTGFPL